MGRVYRLAHAETLDAELVDIERRTGSVEDEFGEQFHSHGRVHKALYGLRIPQHPHMEGSQQTRRIRYNIYLLS